MADLNGDGSADLISGTLYGYIHFAEAAADGGSFKQPVLLLETDGDFANLGRHLDPATGRFVNTVTSVPDSADAAIPFHYDSDDRLDLLLVGNKVIGVIQNEPEGSGAPVFSSRKEVLVTKTGGPESDTSIEGACLRDYDGDGLSDIIVIEKEDDDQDVEVLNVLLHRRLDHDSEYAFAPPVKLFSTTLCYQMSIDFADLDGKGQLDLVVACDWAEEPLRIPDSSQPSLYVVYR